MVAYLRLTNNCTAPTEAFKTSADRDDSLPKLEPETRHGKHILPGDSTQKDKTEETQKLHTNKPSAKTQCCIAIKKCSHWNFSASGRTCYTPLQNNAHRQKYT